MMRLTLYTPKLSRLPVAIPQSIIDLLTAYSMVTVIRIHAPRFSCFSQLEGFIIVLPALRTIYLSGDPGGKPAHGVTSLCPNANRDTPLEVWTRIDMYKVSSALAYAFFASWMRSNRRQVETLRIHLQDNTTPELQTALASLLQISGAVLKRFEHTSLAILPSAYTGPGTDVSLPHRLAREWYTIANLSPAHLHHHPITQMDRLSHELDCQNGLCPKWLTLCPCTV